MAREPAERALCRWMMALGELLASSRRSSSSVFRLWISRSSRSLSWDTAFCARSLAATFGSLRPVSSVRCSSRAFSSTLDSAISEARRRAKMSWSGSSRSASITPRVMGREVLPAACRFSRLRGRLPLISACSASSLASYSSWISGVRPTPGVVTVLLQVSQVRCSCSPSTRTAQAAASVGELQAWQARLPPHWTGSIELLSSTSRPLTRL